MALRPRRLESITRLETAPQPLDLVLIYDVSEPDVKDRTKAIYYRDFIASVTAGTSLPPPSGDPANARWVAALNAAGTAYELAEQRDDTARTNATAARTAAGEARIAADNAQTAADNAQTAADNAQTAADGKPDLSDVQSEINDRVSAAAVARIPVAPPAGSAGENVVWKTDGSRVPGWRPDSEGTSSSGLNEGEVDARILAELPTATEPQAQAPSGTARIIWTVTRLRQLITAALPTISGDDAAAGTSQARRAWTALRVRQAINAILPSWARIGNTDKIPETKLPEAATEGLNQSEVDARVQNAINTHAADADAHHTPPVIPDPPAYIQTFTAADLSVSSATETVVQTIAITPRAAGTRVHITGHIDCEVTAGTNNATRDLGMEIRLYRGAVQLLARNHRGGKFASGELVRFHLDAKWLDTPSSTDEQIYTIRVVRLGGNRTWTISDRQLIAHEVL